MAARKDLGQLSLEQLLTLDVSIASKKVESLNDAPGVISVLTAREIQQMGANNLIEVLEKVTSFYPTGSNFFPQNVMSVRGDLGGHYDNHVLLLLNGRPVRESYSGGVNFSIYLAIPLEVISRLEIIRGPGSVLYGTNAYSSVINIITGDRDDNEFTLRLTGGSLETGDASFGLWYEGAIQLQAGLRYFREDGWLFEAVDNNGETGARRSGEENLGSFLALKWKGLTLNALFTDSDQDFLGASVAWAGEPPVEQRQMISRRSFIDVGYEAQLRSNWRLNTNLSYGRMSFDHYNYKAFSNDLFAEITSHLSFDSGINWVVGATWWHQKVGSEGRLRDAPVPDFTTSWWSAYTQIDYWPVDSLKLIAGGQFNKPKGVDSDIVSRVGAIYHFNERFGAKLLFSEAFRSAFGVETGFLLILRHPDGTVRGGLRGNPSLGPEKTATTDLQFFYSAGRHNLALTLFRGKQTNLVTRERAPDGVLDFINEGSLTSRGLELEGKWVPGDRFYLTGSYSWQTNENESGIEDFTFVPNHMARLGVSWKRGENTTISLYDSWSGKAGDVIVRNPNRAAANPAADTHHLVSGSFQLDLDGLNAWRKVQATLTIRGYNLLDEDVYHPEFIGRRINTLPARSGTTLYADVTLKF